jgi:hypothetical protein
MKTRTTALALAGALLASCSGIGGAGNGLLPSTALQPDVIAGRHRVNVAVRMRIPRAHRGERRPVHPATISPLTQSVTIAVNRTTPVTFNATIASSNCTVGTAGRTCSFAVTAPPGTDTFAVTTYSAANAGGTALDYAIATVPIAKGKTNQVAITLGPVVTTTADSGIGSLRYAIGSANRGDTVAFLLPAAATIALASPIQIFGNVVIAGPGASTLTISGGNAHQLFLNAGTLTISGLTLTGGSASVTNLPGGAIYNDGSLTLANDVIGNSTSTVSLRRVPHAAARIVANARGKRPHCTATYNEGGALYNNAALVVTGTTFTGNLVMTNVAGCVEGRGGAIYNDTGGSLSSTGDTYQNNSAVQGGAVFNESAFPVSFTNDTFNANTGCNAFNGCPTNGCSGSTCASFALGNGAAIFDDVTSVGISVSSSTFENNVAGGASNAATGVGGALLLSGGAPVITGSTFSGNLAGGGHAFCSNGQGGAIAAGVNVELDNDTFTNNQASGDNTSAGGAIYDTASVSGSGDTFTGNGASAVGSACTTSASGIGGAVAVPNGSTTVTFGNSTFANNSASGNTEGGGGAIICNYAFLTKDTFTANAATGTGANGSSGAAGAGGALYVVGTAKVSGSTFASNTATAQSSVATEAIGGAIGSSGALISSNNTFTSNSATSAGSSSAAVGGAEGAASGVLASSGDTFSSNSVSDAAGTIAAGGAVYLAATYTFSNATFSDNHAGGATSAGGAFAATQPGQFTNVSMTGNASTGTTVGSAGAIYDTGGMKIIGGNLAQNSAGTAGGAITSESNLEALLDVNISSNTVTNASLGGTGGAAIYDNGGLLLLDSTVANNTVTVSGSGLGGGIVNVAGMESIGSTISGNSVLGTVLFPGGGAGILSAAPLTMIDSTISGNISKGDGGGILVGSSGGTSLTNVTIFQNTASGLGGNLDLISGSTATLTNTIVAGGSASAGADVDNAGTLTSGTNNLIGKGVTGSFTPGSGDKIGSAGSPIDPLLLPLANNGGPTFTNADQLGSPGRGAIAYSGGNCGAATLTSDQRGFTRGAGGVCDIGAYEYAGVATAIRHRGLHAHVRVVHMARPLVRLPRVTPLKL